MTEMKEDTDVAYTKIKNLQNSSHVRNQDSGYSSGEEKE